MHLHLQGAQPHAKYYPVHRFACTVLKTFGPSARSLYPHLADGYLLSTFGTTCHELAQGPYGTLHSPCQPEMLIRLTWH